MRDLHVLIFTIWVLFWLYWFISAFKTGKTTNIGKNGLFSVRFIILIIVLILLRTNHIHSKFWSNILGSKSIAYNIPLEIIGTLIVVGSLSFAIWARVNLGKNWAMPMTHKKDAELITTGPYRYVRNPIYTGLIFATLGTTIAVGLPWLIIFLITTISCTYISIREENYLQNKFGESYTKYKKTSKMLIPFIY